jgi:hypothetical protein
VKLYKFGDTRELIKCAYEISTYSHAHKTLRLSDGTVYCAERNELFVVTERLVDSFHAEWRPVSIRPYVPEPPAPGRWSRLFKRKPTLPTAKVVTE